MEEAYLRPTAIIDSDHDKVVQFARNTIKAAKRNEDPTEKAVLLYYAVRDGIWYDPYYPFYLPEHYRASKVLASGRAFCIPKAALLCALGRACGIPARVGFATVKNHLATRQLIDFIGSDLFVYHGYTEFYLDGLWVKATPAFNAELCRKHHVVPLEFTGREDSIFQAYNLEKKRFMEYVAYHGTYADIPVATIVAAWEEAYGRERVRRWKRDLEATGGRSRRDFTQETVVAD